DWDVRGIWRGFQLFCERNAIDVGQPEVSENDVRFVMSENLQGLCSVPSGHDFVSFCRENRAKELQISRVVFDYKHIHRVRLSFGSSGGNWRPVQEKFQHQ